MQRMKRWKEKFHRRSGRSKAFKNISCLAVISILLIATFLFVDMEALAQGYLKVTSSDPFWSDIIIKDGVEIWQEFKATPSVESGLKSDSPLAAMQYSSKGDSANACYYTEIPIDYVRNNNFKLSISEHKLKASEVFEDDLVKIKNGSFQWIEGSNPSRRVHYRNYNLLYTPLLQNYQATYYYVCTDSENVNENIGQDLFEAYKEKYNQEVTSKNASNVSVVTKAAGDSGISIEELKNFVDGYFKEKGFESYSSGAEISLTQDRKMVKGVQMITVNLRNLYYSASVRKFLSNTTFRTVDLNLMVYTTHNYAFKYESQMTELKEPGITTESGKSISTGISKDDLIVLQDSNTSGSAKMQYYLSNSVIKDLSSVSWTDYTEPISPQGKKYIYVRSNYADQTKNFIESEGKRETISYLPVARASASSAPASGSYMDVGDKVLFSKINAPENAAIYYAIVESSSISAPTLTKVSYEERKTLNLDEISDGGKYVTLSDQVYIQSNGLWYKSSDQNLKQYNGEIKLDSSLRIGNESTIYVLIEDSGKELGRFQKFQYYYKMSSTTSKPQTMLDTSEENPTVVKIGSSIGLLCNTSGSRIFYTTDGSSPVIVQDPVTGKPVAGAGSTTKEYDNDQRIIVSEENAQYGQKLVIMAQAVTYEKTGNKYYRASQDSPVVKFTYMVADQTPVESVKSIPQTNADKPAEVQIGSMIQLYSPTDGVDIYYTLDGTEPDFDENGTPKGTTKKYSGSTGIKVEKSENSSLFTITAVANKQGLAVSDISRLVFSYPGAVTSPYANPASGAVAENTQVTLKSATEGAIVYYEIAYGTDTPNDPTTASKVFDAANPIVITKKTTIKAYAVKNSMESTVSTFTYTVSDKLKTPTPSIDTGAVVASGTVISLSADSGATIYYTLDGSDPKDASNKKVQVGSNVIINGQSGTMIMLRTYAAKQGFTSSDSGTYSYSVSAYTGGIYADRESGSIVKNGDTVYLHTDMTDAKVYYTVDGSAPTENSHSGNSVTIHGNPGEQFTIMAMAVAEGSEKSTSFATFTYTIMNKLAAPTSSIPDGAIFIKESVVELKAETGRIYYTTDGTDPTTSSNLYKKSITIDKEMTIKAMAVADDLEQSDISTFHYGYADQVAAPIASYASGELEMGTKVTFTCATEGATIYYRTDGKEINLSEKNELEIYKEPITINKATNFKVIAIKDKMQDSKVLTVGYTVKEPVVSEIQEAETQQIYEDQGNRLQSRRSFSDTESGPSYTDVVLRNASYGAVIAAEEGILPESVQLRVESTNVTDAVNRRVQQVISDSYGVVASYDVTLLVNGEETQPDGTIEIGLPIPVEYENAMLHIVHVLEDGNIELYETRRSGGIAYAKVDHLSVYSIAAPVEFEEEKTQFPWLPVVYSLAVGMTGLGCFLIYKAKKEKREDGMQDD